MKPEGSTSHWEWLSDNPYPEPNQTNPSVIIFRPSLSIMCSEHRNTEEECGEPQLGVSNRKHVLYSEILEQFNIKRAGNLNRLFCINHLADFKFPQSSLVHAGIMYFHTSPWFPLLVTYSAYNNFHIYIYIYMYWSLTLREECRLRVFVNWILRRIFGPNGEWRRLHNEELHSLYR